MPPAATALHLRSSGMPPTLSGPKPMIPICNYTTSSSSPRYALSSGNRLRVCRCSIESATNVPDKDCVVFYKECRSPLAWFRTSSTSSDKGFLISAKKREDDVHDKGLSASSEVKPTGFDGMQSSLDGSYNPQPPSSGNPDLLKIPGVGKKNLTKLVENDIADVDELKKIYKDKFNKKSSQKMVDFLQSSVGIKNRLHAKSITTFIRKSVIKEMKDGGANSDAIPSPKKKVKEDRKSA